MEVKKQWPLQWPDNWRRTFLAKPSKFGRYSIEVVTNELRMEIKRLTKKDELILSTNLKIRNNGFRPLPAVRGFAERMFPLARYAVT